MVPDPPQKIVVGDMGGTSSPSKQFLGGQGGPGPPKFTFWGVRGEQIFSGIRGGGLDPKFSWGTGAGPDPHLLGRTEGGPGPPKKSVLGVLRGFPGPKFFWGVRHRGGLPIFGRAGRVPFWGGEGWSLFGGDLWSHFWEGKGVVFPREEWEVSIFGWAVRAEFLGGPFFGLVLEILF